MIRIAIAAILLGLMIHELTKPGELLQAYARFVNFKLKKYFYIHKLLICPWCIAGQFALWSSVLKFYITDPSTMIIYITVLNAIISIGLAIVVTKISVEDEN